MSRAGVWWTCYAIVVLSFTASAGLLSWSSRSPTDRSRIAAARDFINLKTGSDPSRQALWYYSGIVRNPSTGGEVVGIEGVELARRCSSPSVQHTPHQNYTTTGRDMYQGTYLSKKLFTYVDLVNRTSPLDHFRVRHHAPLRNVKATKTYSERVTVGVDATGRSYTTIEWPGSHRLMKTYKLTLEPARSLPGIARLFGKQKVNAVHFMSGAPPRRQSQRPSWTRWVSLRPTNVDSSVGRSQEYYHIESGHGEGASLPTWSPGRQSPPSPGPGTATGGGTAGVPKQRGFFNGLRTWLAPLPSATLHYRRYGEGPAWYAVARPCITELRGYRFRSEESLPRYVRDLVKRVEPGFFDCSVDCGGTASEVPTSCMPTGTGTSEGGSCLRGSRSNSKGKARRRAETGLSMEWFAHQRDPAEIYQPWYTVLGGAIGRVAGRWGKRTSPVAFN